MDIKGVPVVMYHGVGPPCPGWPWNHLFTLPGVFEAQMKALRDEGWNAVTLDMLHAHMEDGAPLPGKPFVLTFDDGYLNNWTYAYPIIREYGHRAVVWMTTDFIDPSTTPRPTLEDVRNGNLSQDELQNRGFLSLAEMSKMEEDGTFEVQSHAATHTWYFSGPRIVDFHRPKGVEGYRAPPWLAWNRMPERKHEYMSVALEDEVPWGTPIYEHGKSLVTRRYFPDDELAARLAMHVERHGGAAFFDRPGWRDELLMLSGGGEETAGGRYESDEEFSSRVRSELVDSREILERSLGKEVAYLCWPGGGINQGLLSLAEVTGYRATTSLYQAKGRRNLYGEDPREINRTGCGAPWQWRGRFIHRTDPGFFIAILEDFNGDPGAIWKMRAYKLKYIVRCLLGQC